VTLHSFRKTTATLLDQAGLQPGLSLTSWDSDDPRWPRTSTWGEGRWPQGGCCFRGSTWSLGAGVPDEPPEAKNGFVGIKWVWRPSAKEDRQPAGLW